MRYLPTVIDAMVKEIPSSGNEDLIRELNSVKGSAMYAAPENIRMWWVRAAEALEDGVGDPSGADWKMKVSKIFADEINVGA